eukprot:TRINITY_DN14301_c0_g1_i1.p1 TRINITY_DN14301_c0_g1~~TRINITY_DN14301_c0_g1_i1.p1  ORF type:complete len:324 (+),score=55.32 TRINITY_DN14301_c0_g1_i1:138-974(+)
MYSDLNNTYSLYGWELDNEFEDFSNVCSIDKIKNPSLEKFINEYLLKERPLIIEVDPTENKLFRELTSKENLLKYFGDSLITLSSANTFSYDKSFTTLKYYIENSMNVQTLDKTADSTFYHFGDNNYQEFGDFFDCYNLPFDIVKAAEDFYRKKDDFNLIYNGDYSKIEVTREDIDVAFSFGLAGSRTGVPFHVHGPVFAEVVQGKKKWILLPPNEDPPFDPNKTSYYWFDSTYEDYNKRNDNLQECVLEPNQILYIPNEWYHLTFNIGQSVFISAFL